MNSLNDFYDYDIESPRSSEIKTSAIENSIQRSLLVNNEVSKNYNINIINSVFLKILFWFLVLGIISIVVLLVLKKLP
jgi:hypothetical protein